MAGDLNKVCLIGRLGKDPETRSFQNGGQVCNFSIATSESWKDKSSGEKREKTEWHSIAIFSDGLAKVAADYLRKGSKVYVEGKLQTRKWQDQAGNDKYTTEVVLQGFDAKLLLLDGKRDGGGSSGGGQSSGGGASGGWGEGNSTGRSGSAFDEDLDDSEVPF